MERLQKYLARCGVASRRKAEIMIAEGHVSVNGEIITEMGYKVSANDTILVDGKSITIKEHVYYVLNKPRGVISTVSDDKNRKSVISILPDEIKDYRVFPVGRLDYDTKGVLLLTNDGDFMNMLVGPKSNIEKEYLARVDGLFPKELIGKVVKGFKVDDYVTRPAKIYIEEYDKKNNSSLVKLIINEGKNHQVKKMLSTLGYPVKRLTRTRFGSVTIDGLKEGEIRELTPHELKTLYGMASSNNFK